MKKILLFLSVIAMLATSCGEKDAFTINGTLPSGEYDGQKVFLQTMDSTWNQRNLVTIDTAEILDGKFIFKGLAKQGPTIHFIKLDQAPDFMQRPYMLVVEPGVIEMSLDTMSLTKGTLVNDALQSYMTTAAKFGKEMNAMFQQVQADTANTALKEEFEKKAEEGYKAQAEGLYNLTKANITNQVGAFFYTAGFGQFTDEQKNELIAQIKPEYKSMERFEKLAEILEKLNATAVGKQFTDVKAKTPEGNDMALSDYAGKGKIVLVDFWASWCGPCIQEMPKVKEAYAKYKDKGFEIVAISLDQSEEAWKKAIKDLDIPWPQMSDLKAWQSEPADAYGVRSIPHTVLIDKDGKIIARDLRGDKITEKLSELLD